MAKKKRLQKAVTTKPRWVGEVNLSNCENGKVYNIYQCRTCILENKTDKARPKRKKTIHIPGYKKKQFVEICFCELPLLIKYKKCTCGQEYWGFFLREHPTCKTCGTFTNSDYIKKKKWYRLTDFYIASEEDLSDKNKWDCINRNTCLECTFDSGSKKGLACKDCPHYEKGNI